MMEVYTVAFFGHRMLDYSLQIENRLDIIIKRLISEKTYVEFLVGRNGEFDQYVSSAIIRTKRTYRDDNSFHILVLPYATAEYLNNVRSFEEYYDEIEICQESARAHYKSAIQIRNRLMVDRADLIVCCIDRELGGAYQTIQYAQKQKKRIINLAAGEREAPEMLCREE